MVAFLLPVAFSPSVQATFWTPAAALCVVVAGVGGVRLLRLAADRDRAAVAAASFVAVALVSALLADNRTLSAFGLYGWGTGWLFVLALAGAWAIGRTISLDSRTLLESALIAAVLVNAAFAVLEMAFDLTMFHLGKTGGRAPGLLGNPVHLGGLCAAGLVLVADRFDRRSHRWGAALTLAVVGAHLSGSRAAVALVVVATAWLAWRRPRSRWWLVGLVALGFLIGSLVISAGGGASVTQRVQTASASGGFGPSSPRALTWRAAIGAMGERPLLGTGPGLFRDAVADRRTVALAQREGSERMFVDAHNVVVEYATTTGLIGLAAAALWFALSVRGASGPLLGFALVLLGNHLVQPQAVRTTPVMLLALGASLPALVPRPARIERVAFAVVGLVSLFAAGRLLVGDFHLEQGRLDFVHYHARAALDLLPRWAEPAVLEARIYLFDERVNRRPEDTEAALHWLRIAAERDRGNPTTWAVLGENLLANGLDVEGRAALHQALDANPTSVRVMNDLGIAAQLAGDDAEARRWFRRSLVVRPGQRSIRERLDAVEGGP